MSQAAQNFESNLQLFELASRNDGGIVGRKYGIYSNLECVESATKAGTRYAYLYDPGFQRAGTAVRDWEGFPLKDSKRPYPRKRLLEVLSLCLSLLGTGLTLLDSQFLSPWHKAVIITVTLSLPVVSFKWKDHAFLTRLLAFVFFKWVHRNQAQAAIRYQFYGPRALQTHAALLKLNLRDLARETGIPLLALSVFRAFPQLIPKPKYLNALEKALKLPKKYFMRGGSYGLECSIARFLRYSELECVGGWTLERIKRASLRQIDEILGAIEAERLQDLREEGKVP